MSFPSPLNNKNNPHPHQYHYLSLLHSCSNLKQLIRQSWFSMVNMHNDAEIPHTRHWNLQLPNQNKKSSSKANKPESMEKDWQRTGREEGEETLLLVERESGSEERLLLLLRLTLLLLLLLSSKLKRKVWEQWCWW